MSDEDLVFNQGDWVQDDLVSALVGTNVNYARMFRTNAKFHGEVRALAQLLPSMVHGMAMASRKQEREFDREITRLTRDGAVRGVVEERGTCETCEHSAFKVLGVWVHENPEHNNHEVAYLTNSHQRCDICSHWITRHMGGWVHDKGNPSGYVHHEATPRQSDVATT